MAILNVTNDGCAIIKSSINPITAIRFNNCRNVRLFVLAKNRYKLMVSDYSSGESGPTEICRYSIWKTS